MKNKTLENKTDTQTRLSPYQAERAEAQETPVARPAHAGEALLRVQRRVGNRAVQRLLVQRLELAGAEEPQMTPNADVSRHGHELEQVAEGLMMKSQSEQVGLEGGPVVPEVEAAIQRARGGGQPLDGAVQAQMSDAMGHEFSRVRVHADAESDTLNQRLTAEAFTTGHDIFFRRGAYNPGSGRGRELIAHELTHVLQQRKLREAPGGRMTVRPAGEAFEQEADSVAHAAATRKANSGHAHGSGDGVAESGLSTFPQSPDTLGRGREADRSPSARPDGDLAVQASGLAGWPQGGWRDLPRRGLSRQNPRGRQRIAHRVIQRDTFSTEREAKAKVPEYLGEGSWELVEWRGNMSGNCHGYSMHDDTSETLLVETLPALREYWKSTPNFASKRLDVYLLQGTIAHTSRGERHKINEGPVISLDPDAYADAVGYEDIFQLKEQWGSLEAALEKVEAEAAAAAGVDSLWKGLMRVMEYKLGGTLAARELPSDHLYWQLNAAEGDAAKLQELKPKVEEARY